LNQNSITGKGLVVFKRSKGNTFGHYKVENIPG